MMNDRGKKLWILVLLCGCFSVGCRKSVETEASGGRAQFVVDTATLVPRPLRDTLSATGTLLAREAITLQAERSGVVRELLFVEGESVGFGDTLVIMDDSELQAQLDRALAGLELATAIEARDRSLFEMGTVISEAEYERSIASLGVARAEAELIRAQLAKTRIRAPFAGIAGLRRVSVGSYLTPGTPICSFQAIDSLRLDFRVPERYAGYLRPGQQIAFRVAGRVETFEGTLSAIEPAIDIATRSLWLRAVAANEGGRLLPGAFAEVEVVLDEVSEAILIPPIALIPGLERQTVYLHREGRVEERPVRTGLRSADAVEIVEGLQAGEELITTGILQLRPGMPVQVRAESRLESAR